MEKHVVTISRNWNRPEIKTTVSDKSISVEMGMEDFKQAVLVEIGSVTWVFGDNTFKTRFEAAVSKVLDGMKQETVKVVV